MKNFFLILGVLIAILSCGCVNLNYIGDNYPPTQEVRFLFAPAEIPGNWLKMGEATAWMDDDDAIFLSDSAINDKIRLKAMAVGANAVLIVTSGRELVGTASSSYSGTSYHERTKEKSKSNASAVVVGDGYGAVAGARQNSRSRSETDGYVSGSSSATTRNLSQSVVKAYFYRIR